MAGDTTRSTDSGPAWGAQELASDPHERADKAERVRRMFGAIAGKYELNNRVHSFGRDRAWRRYAVRAAAPKGTDHVLDVACGTGDLTRAFAEAGVAQVTGLDFTPEMLAVARTHRIRARHARQATAPVIRYVQGDAMELPFADGSFDVLSIAFGIRNVADPARALREFRRILRPGGRLVVLEFGRPRLAPVAWVNDFYCRVIMPRTATLISGDTSGAYKYLPRSIDTFLTPDAMSGAIQDAGFAKVTMRPLTMGVCMCYRAETPG